MSCDLCGHVYAHVHRITPGCWGGRYELSNIVELCPNHHAAVHLLMKWFHRGLGTEDEEERLEEYMSDRELMSFWLEAVKPAVIRRMVAEGRWHPYIRTLPDIVRKPVPRRKRKSG